MRGSPGTSRSKNHLVLHYVRRQIACSPHDDSSSGTVHEYHSCAHVYKAHGQHVDRQLRLSCFVCLPQIVHTALAAFNIVMQQYSEQISAEPLPLNVTKRHNHSTITYRATYVVKVIEWASFANADEAGLMQVGALILWVACTPSSALPCDLADHPSTVQMKFK